ncbi:MAG: substrate-binding domain-containing protein, partial [Armatimonadetes bacterium]|nr:substrate-binding domain-containing protein [Anaerolineae bacterium]
APNATIIGRYPGAIIANAKESISQLIADGVDFNVIASINDAGSYGAIEALEAAGIDPNSVIIVSVDAETRAQEYIRDGYYLRGSVAVARTDFARASISLIVKQLAGATLPEVTILAPGEVVTAITLARQASN